MLCPVVLVGDAPIRSEALDDVGCRSIQWPRGPCQLIGRALLCRTIAADLRINGLVPECIRGDAGHVLGKSAIYRCSCQRRDHGVARCKREPEGWRGVPQVLHGRIVVERYAVYEAALVWKNSGIREAQIGIVNGDRAAVIRVSKLKE